MKSNKKRGFTLVELLVVIAILAILATVSVVGYTSFIERATISNDENVASQLNQFLIALKADSNSEYYQVKIDETNAREITRYILRESGLDELEPQSEKYGYHFYFDLANQKYVLAADRDVTSSLATRMFAHAEGEKYFLGSCFTDGNYFLADTKGDLAEVINAIYTADSKSAVDEAIQAIDRIKDANIKSVVSAFVNNSVIITDDMNYQVSGDAIPANIIFADGTVMVGNTTTNRQSESIWSDASTSTTLSSTNKVVIPNSVEYFAENSLNIADNGEIVINKTPEKIGKMAQDVFANTTITITTTNGQFICNVENAGASVDVIVSTTDSSVKIELTYTNPIQDFTASVIDSDKLKNDYDNGNSAYVAWDLGQFDLILNTVGENAQIPATDVNITWKIKESGGAGVTFEGNTVKLDNNVNNVTDDIVIVGRNAAPDRDGNPIEYEFTIKVAKINSAEVSIINKTLPDVSKLTFVHSKVADNNSHSVSVVTLTYNKYGTTVQLDSSISLSSTASGLTIDGSNIKSNAGESATTTGKLTVNVGGYVTHTVDYVVYDSSKFEVYPTKNDIFLGTNQDIKLDNLFSGTIPAGAELRVFGNVDSNDDYMVLNRGDMYTIAEKNANEAVTCGIDKISIANASFDSTIKFEGTRTQQVYFAFFVDGVRVSDDLRVTVVDAKNVTQFSELTGGTNYALLSNIEFTAANSSWSFSGGTFYGNQYKFDITKGKTTSGFGIITLNNATMRDTRVIGAIYPQVGIANYDPYGTNAIWATGTTTIDNCYIANTRAPICAGNEDGDVNTDKITIKNSVIFGGKYCNIDLRNGTLTFEGKVITINQPHTNAADASTVALNDKTVGLGVTVWFEALRGTKIVGGDKLVQYNFIPQTYTNLPIITISKSGITAEIKTAKVFNSIFTDTTGRSSNTLKYADYIFGTDTKYINAGIIGEDLGAAASLLKKPNGDRTGFNGGSTISSDIYKYSKCSYEIADFYNTYLHIYGIKKTNTALFAESQNAEYKYSPWNQTVGNTTYPEYDFVNGNIIH